MPWTGHFVNSSVEEKVSFLSEYLKLWEISENKESEQAFYDTLKYIVGGICLKSEYGYVSKKAKEILKKNYKVETPLPNKKYEGLTNEHIIPCKVIADFLMKKLRSNPKELTEEYLTKVVNTINGIALITKEENKALNKAKVRTSLSPNKDVAFEDILNKKVDVKGRYSYAGIELC